MLAEKTCLGCGQAFQTTNSRQICCSRTCWLGYNRIRKNPEKFRERNCLNCGKPIENAPHRSGIRVFCNKNCSSTYYYKKAHESLLGTETACPWCGKTFVRKNNQHVYCSRICQYTSKNMRKRSTQTPKVIEKKICQGCGKAFQPNGWNQICCSRTCWLAVYNKRMNPEKFRERNCPNCGKPVENDPHRAGVRLFCCEKCKRAYYHKKTYQSKMTEERICPQCGKSFVRSSGHQKYCSRACWHENYNIVKHPGKYGELNCLQCGIPIINDPHSHGRQLFCSDKCSSKYHDLKQKDKNRKPFVKKVCLHCGKAFVTNLPFQVCCSERCRSRCWNEHRAPGTHDEKVCPKCGKTFRQSYDTRGRQRYCCDACMKETKLKRDSDALSWAKFEQKSCIISFKPDLWRKQLAALANQQGDSGKQRRILLMLGERNLYSLHRMIAFVSYKINADPCSGDLYVFCNRARTMLRYFEWDGAEFCVGYRRSHRGTIPWPWAKECATMEITETEWEFLLHKSTRTLMRTNLNIP